MEKIGTLLWDELLRIPTGNPVWELVGFLETLPHTANRDFVLVSCPKLVIARRLLSLWRGLKEPAFNATMRTGEGVLELDKERGKALFRISKHAYRRLLAHDAPTRKADRWAWCRGVWGGSGSIYLPQSGYYMTLRIKDERNLSGRLLNLLRSAGIVPGRREKQGKIEFMIRDQEQIVTVLSGMGLTSGSLRLEETAIMRSLRSKANKLVNCDSANINKSLLAAQSQLQLIDKLERRGLWEELPPSLQELAQVRRANPSVSLRELGQILAKPVSKSTVEYRWRKLESIVHNDEL